MRRGNSDSGRSGSDSATANVAMSIAPEAAVPVSAAANISANVVGAAQAGILRPNTKPCITGLLDNFHRSGPIPICLRKYLSSPVSIMIPRPRYNPPNAAQNPVCTEMNPEPTKTIAPPIPPMTKIRPTMKLPIASGLLFGERARKPKSPRPKTSMKVWYVSSKKTEHSG